MSILTLDTFLESCSKDQVICISGLILQTIWNSEITQTVRFQNTLLNYLRSVQSNDLSEGRVANSTVEIDLIISGNTRVTIVGYEEIASDISVNRDTVVSIVDWTGSVVIHRDS